MEIWGVEKKKTRKVMGRRRGGIMADGYREMGSYRRVFAQEQSRKRY